MSKNIRTTVLAVAAVAAFAVPALAETTNCTITAPEIYLRKSPNKKAKVLTTLKKNAQVTADKACQGGWVKVTSQDNKFSGYVGGWALAPAASTVAESTPAPVAEPAPSAPVQREIPSNEKLAMQITELRLNVLGIERDMQQMRKEIKRIKVSLKRNGSK